MGNGMKFPTLKCKKINKAEGSVVVVTGGSSGLGK